MENLGVRRPVVGSIAWLGLLAVPSVNRFWDRQLVPFSPQSINLKPSNRILSAPYDESNLFTFGCSPEAIADGRRGICGVVWSKIDALAATAALCNRAEALSITSGAIGRVGACSEAA